VCRRRPQVVDRDGGVGRAHDRVAPAIADGLFVAIVDSDTETNAVEPTPAQRVVGEQIAGDARGTGDEAGLGDEVAEESGLNVVPGVGGSVAVGGEPLGGHRVVHGGDLGRGVYDDAGVREDADKTVLVRLVVGDGVGKGVVLKRL
jgi:hypothetical protein